MKYLLPLTVLLGCLTEQDEARIRRNNTEFYYHHKSRLCFAHYDRGIAHVPCTPEVLALCPNKP